MISKKVLLTIALSLATAAPALAQTFPVRNGLPPTSMDSFVHEAAGSACNIYGDEGFEGPPPFDSFTVEHRINTGITGVRDEGITTGHGSYMPDAWGGDEWTGNEWSMSGANGGDAQNSYDGNTPNGNTTQTVTDQSTADQHQQQQAAANPQNPNATVTGGQTVGQTNAQ
jgi:hypothetical protein